MALGGGTDSECEPLSTNIPLWKDSPPAFEGQPMRHPRLLPTPAPAVPLLRFNLLGFLRDLAAPTTTPRCAWCGAALTDPTSCALCAWQQDQPDARAAVQFPNYRAPWHRFLATPDDC